MNGYIADEFGIAAPSTGDPMTVTTIATPAASIANPESLGRIAQGVAAETGHGGGVQAHPDVVVATGNPVGAVTANQPAAPASAPAAPAAAPAPAPAPAPAAPAQAPAVNVTVNE